VVPPACPFWTRSDSRQRRLQHAWASPRQHLPTGDLLTVGLWQCELDVGYGITLTTWKFFCRRFVGMPLRKRGPRWHFRFTIDGQEYAGSTKLQATEENRKAAERFEKRQKQLIRSGRSIEHVRDFASAAGEFVAWCKDVEYRRKPNTAGRIATSFASLLTFFGTTPVADIGPGEIERYKSHRIQVNRVRDVTLRHDLHALSLFFQYAEKMRWREGNFAPRLFHNS
jgi:Arm DNA-binding domain